MNRGSTPPNSTRSELLSLQYDLLHRIEDDIADYTKDQSTMLQKYRAKYDADFDGFESIATKKELIAQVLKAQLIFCGDYHTLRQSQRTAIRILREVVEIRPNIVLALEMVDSKHQLLLDSYMADQFSEAEFLNAVNYWETWGFEWSHYRELFEFARKHGLRVVGLNLHPTSQRDVLQQRDRHAADIIVNSIKDDPDALMFVLYGDLHVASEHLPKLTASRLDSASLPKRETLIIHQNNEQLHKLLSQHEIEQAVDVVKLTKGIYCVMNTPPWIKLQTYLNWLENRTHLEDEDASDTADWDESTPYYYQLHNIADTIGRFLQLPKTHFGDFHVYTIGDLEFLDFLNSYLKTDSSLQQRDVELLRAEIIYNGTALIPAQSTIYLSEPGINRSAEKVSQLLHYKVSEAKQHNLDEESDFYRRLLLECFGFFGSKILNHKRKCDSILDYTNMLAATRGKKLTGRLKEQKQIGSLIIKHHRAEQDYLHGKRSRLRLPSLYNQPPRIYYGLTRGLGRILGQHLYSSLIAAMIDKAYVRHLMETNYFEPGIAKTTFLSIIAKLGSHRIPEQSKRDTL